LIVGWGANPNIVALTDMAMLGFAPQPAASMPKMRMVSNETTSLRMKRKSRECLMDMDV
jgi:hypothetical protein